MAAFELAYEARGLWVPHVGWSDSFEGVDNAAVAAALPSLLTRRTDEFLSSKRSSALRPRGTRGQQQPVTARLDWKSSTEEAGSTRTLEDFNGAQGGEDEGDDTSVATNGVFEDVKGALADDGSPRPPAGDGSGHDPECLSGVRRGKARSLATKLQR
ncbi:hypothetical protein THAOC_33255 [Thalassiosira oceanica]|uniref:Uncharacterized protein n=1 Tax=Thalassiosira oceanica TaxID=159749 RepID=K0RMM2_THAOC|nr:hypothetical protein THAOC_33255 [Thalassiosira oceanica]|eukprot:EJK47987.1 hypothetical protein THAOC_33255 [Thalassiosira oceanica]